MGDNSIVTSLRDRYDDILNQRYGLVDNLLHLPFLRGKARGNVLEIGVSRGNSTIALLLGVKENGGHVYSVDINRDCGSILTDSYPDWTFIWGDSVHAWQYISEMIPSTIDVAYIDGDHSYEAVKSDIGNVLSKMAEDGIVLVHDVCHPDYPGVQRAFNEYGAAFERCDIRKGSWGLGVIYIGGGNRPFNSIWGADRGGR